MKKGFSFAEVLVVLLITSTIMLITIPILTRRVANQNAAAYQVLFNQVMQPILSEVMTNASGLFLINGNLSNNSTTATYKYRFCNEFIKKINIVGSSSCTAQSFSTPNFVTTNGMAWYYFGNDFNGAGDYGTGNIFTMTFWVDVNGTNQGQNTSQGSNPDLVRITIYNNGTVASPAVGNIEQTYLNTY